MYFVSSNDATSIQLYNNLHLLSTFIDIIVQVVQKPVAANMCIDSLADVCNIQANGQARYIMEIRKIRKYNLDLFSRNWRCVFMFTDRGLSQYKGRFLWYGDSHVKDKEVIRPSYL